MEESRVKLKNILDKKVTDQQFKYMLWIYCFINAIIFLTICSKNSFFYAFNNWDDPNSFFTMGKGMANGLIIYRDLFEQKGPILYLIHAISYMISNNTFLGVFIFEIISFTVFLYFINKILISYCRKIHVLWSTPLVSYMILSSYVFIAGDSAEEFCLPLFAISLYNILNYYKNTYPNKMPTKQVILNGVIAGCVLWIKYNLLGFWLGFAGFLCIGLLINKKVKDAFLTGFYFLLGMLITSIPWILYFGANHALYDMIDVYFLVNISSYSVQTSILNRLITALKDAWMYAKNLWMFSLITFTGYFYILKSKNVIPNLYGKIALTITILLSVIGVYYGANHIYYFLILMSFIIFGVIGIAKLIEKLLTYQKIKLMALTTPLYIILVIILTCKTSSNFNFHKVKKEELVQYQFAEIIQKQPNATLLNYGFLDGGFYTVSNVIPNIKYFHKPNISYEKYPKIMDEQNRYIKEKVVDFVVLKLGNKEDSYNIEYLYENYQSIKTVEDGNNYYMLFQLKK